MGTRMREGLPLLHKYVIQPQDDMSLVMTKLSFRLCVKEVTGVIHRRSLGHSISEALKYESRHEPMMTTTHHTVEPLVLSSKASPHDTAHMLGADDSGLSPEDAGYCGTMKSDDSGIVMDESQMNFSGDQSDLMFSSTEISPLEEDTCLVNGVSKSPERRLSGSFPGYQEGEKRICVTVIEKHGESHVVKTSQVADFFCRDGTTDSAQEDTTNEDSVPNSWEDLDPSSTEIEEGEVEEEVIPTVTQISETRLGGEEGQQEDSQEDVTEETPEGNFQTDEERCEAQEMEEGEVEGETTTEQDEEPETQPEEERVQFVKGLENEVGVRCDDVQTALQILNTHYKLADTSVRKFIITFSSWNVNQMSHPISKRCSWWESSNALPVENPEVEDLMEDIYQRQGDISELVDQIMEEEKLKQDLARQVEARIARIQEPDDEIIVLTAPSHQAEPPHDGDHQAEPPHSGDTDDKEDKVPEEECEKEDKDNKKDSEEVAGKKKKRNALQRFVHAVRKRMRRNRPQTADKDRAKA